MLEGQSRPLRPHRNKPLSAVLAHDPRVRTRSYRISRKSRVPKVRHIAACRTPDTVHAEVHSKPRTPATAAAGTRGIPAPGTGGRDRRERAPPPPQTRRQKSVVAMSTSPEAIMSR